ncbi:MAG: L,D-transpeptidase family protein, partial [Candidatus Aminicenantes bacterium]|nr:L,D-transpeptidase family protein [Candidatus Aminicenantes bacterium]
MRLRRTAAVVLAVSLFGCRSAPVPREVLEAEAQEQDLRGAGALHFAGPEYAAYLERLALARQALAREDLKLGWFRDYGPVREAFAEALLSGSALKAEIEARSARRSSSFAASADTVRQRLKTLDDLTRSLVEPGSARGLLTRASLALGEADAFVEQERYDEAEVSLTRATALTDEAGRAVISHISRYLDPEQVAAWRRAAEATIAESRRRGVIALVVSKLERKLEVYKNGRLIRTFDIGLGSNGLSDKKVAGDNATPEGRYTIIRKIPRSLYHRALLIDYPNDEDKRAFARGKARGAIAGSAGIGGDIEIHGGGW